jgi:exodeoxyribonuclease V gamma subunit
MFLEALLSARDRLIITWTGRGARDNEPLPPAGPVDELLDVLSTSFRAPLADQQATRARLVTEHPLQPFSPRCFGVTADGKRTTPQSHDARFLAGARALQGPRSVARAFVTGPLPPLPVAGQRTLTVADLARFVTNPMGHFLTTRLGVRFEETAEEVEDREPAELGPLSQWAVANRLLDWTLGGHSADEAYEGLRATGALPLGAPGRCTFMAARALAEPVAAAVRELRGGGRIEPAEVDLDLGVRLVGRVDGLWESGALVLHQASRVRAKHRLGLWARHLALSAMGHERASHLVGRASTGGDAMRVTLRPVRPELATDLLGSLCGLYVRGLEVPLLFFPETSTAWAEVAVPKPDATDKALSAARKAWRTTRDGDVQGEGATAFALRLFGEAQPWPCDPDFELSGVTYADSERFSALSEAILRPLIDHLEES